MGSFTRQTVFVENVEKMTHKRLEEHLKLLAGTSMDLDVVFLYSKMQSQHPLCAAVRMTNLQYSSCMKWNNVDFCGIRPKILQWHESKKKHLAQWILLADGSRISVKGSRHWSTKPDSPKVKAPKEDRKTPSENGGFYQWETIQTQGGECFCYAAFDCGCMLQEVLPPEVCVKPFPKDLVLEKAVEAGVQRLVLLGSSIKKAERAKELAAIYPDYIGFSVGYHPDVSGAWKSEKLSTLRDLASSPHCVAIGECGFDCDIKQVHRKVQYDLLEMQVRLASELRKPLLIYEKGAQGDILKMLKECGAGVPPVAVKSRTWNCDFDCYIQHGCYLVVTGWMFAKSTKDTPFYNWLKSAKPWQLDYLLLASDAPRERRPIFVDEVVCSDYKRYLVGIKKDCFTEKAINCYTSSRACYQRNTPLQLPILIELIAEGASLSPGEVSRKCLENAKRFFQPIERRKGMTKEEVVVGWFGCRWATMSFLLPLALCLIVMCVVGYIHM